MPTSSRPAVLILAAGQGKRLKSSCPKVLHTIYQKPLLGYVLDCVEGLGDPIAVLGHGISEVRAAFPQLRNIHQKKRLGTGHAVLQALSALKKYTTVLIVSGDTPLLQKATLRKLLAAHKKKGVSAVVLTALTDDPAGYGRILRGPKNDFLKIVEEKDASADEKLIEEVNTGTYVFARSDLARLLPKLKSSNVQKEYYLTDLVPMLLAGGKKVATVTVPDSSEAMGINTRADLSLATEELRLRKINSLLEKGVSFVDPMTVHIGPEVKIGKDSTVEPQAFLMGTTRIGKHCLIGTGSVIRNCRLGDGVTVKPYSVMEDSVVGAGAQIGPFAHLRPGTKLGKKVKIGNFVETKKASLADGAKASHLSYLGDAQIGKNANIGAGTITCNYDGVDKHLTVLEDGVFVGSGTQLVAPVRVGKGAYLGAGSTITKDVPAFALALSRARQTTIKNWAKRRKKTKKTAKKK